jgi:hypothetical protein
MTFFISVIVTVFLQVSSFVTLLPANVRFADLNLRSPVLSYIKVSRCSALRSVTITSNALQVSSYVFILPLYLLVYKDFMVS